MPSSRAIWAIGRPLAHQVDRVAFELGGELAAVPWLSVVHGDILRSRGVSCLRGESKAANLRVAGGSTTAAYLGSMFAWPGYPAPATYSSPAREDATSGPAAW